MSTFPPTKWNEMATGAQNAKGKQTNRNVKKNNRNNLFPEILTSSLNIFHRPCMSCFMEDYYLSTELQRLTMQNKTCTCSSTRDSLSDRCSSTTRCAFFKNIVTSKEKCPHCKLFLERDVQFEQHKRTITKIQYIKRKADIWTVGITKEICDLHQSRQTVAIVLVLAKR